MTDQITNATLPIAALQPHPANYNRHPDAQIERLRLSLRRFGQPRSIVIQAVPPAPSDPSTPSTSSTSPSYLIVAGHGVAQAARLEGWTHLRCDIIPAAWPDPQVRAYLAADNELAHGADPDEAALAQLVADIQAQADADLAALAAGSAERLRELLDNLPVPEFKEYDESAADDVEMIECPKCGHSFPK